jgi:hypothetical protein
VLAAAGMVVGAGPTATASFLARPEDSLGTDVGYHITGYVMAALGAPRQLAESLVAAQLRAAAVVVAITGVAATVAAWLVRSQVEQACSAESLRTP